MRDIAHRVIIIRRVSLIELSYYSSSPFRKVLRIVNRALFIIAGEYFILFIVFIFLW